MSKPNINVCTNEKFTFVSTCAHVPFICTSLRLCSGMNNLYNLCISNTDTEFVHLLF